MSNPIHCPHCKHTVSTVAETRFVSGPDALRRIRRCKLCNDTWITFEAHATDLERTGPVVRLEPMTTAQAENISIHVLNISNQLAAYAAGSRKTMP